MRKLAARVTIVRWLWRVLQINWPVPTSTVLGFVDIWDQFVCSRNSFEVRFAVFCDQLGDYLEEVLQRVLDYIEKTFQAAPGEDAGWGGPVTGLGCRDGGVSGPDAFLAWRLGNARLPCGTVLKVPPPPESHLTRGPGVAPALAGPEEDHGLGPAAWCGSTAADHVRDMPGGLEACRANTVSGGPRGRGLGILGIGGLGSGGLGAHGDWGMRSPSDGVQPCSSTGPHPRRTPRPPTRVLTECKHAFHARCADGWLCKHARCPTCRTRIVL